MKSRLLGVLALVAVAAIAGWYVLGGAPKGHAPEPAALTAQTAGAETRAALESVLGLLKSVKDTASADAVVPAIQAATNKLNGIAAFGAGLPAGGKAELAKIAGDVGAGIQSEIVRIQALPGVYEVLKPKMERLMLMHNIVMGQSYEVLKTMDN